MSDEIKIAYKGMNNDMTCRGMKYEVGKGYVAEGDIDCCNNGLHACEMPLGVFEHYAPNTSRYFEVEPAGDISKSNESDTKFAARQLKIKAEIGIPGIVKAQVEWVKKQIGFDEAVARANEEKENHTTGWSGAASATGVCGAASATGVCGAASATGVCGAASATGWRGAASATGVCGAASATGVCGAASATGVCGAASATGWRGAASATGESGAASATGARGAASATGVCGAASATGVCGAASATGWSGAASATGESGAASATGARGAASATGWRGAASATGVCGAASATGWSGAASAMGTECAAMTTGFNGRVKGKVGCVICCIERGEWNGKTYPILSVKSDIIDGEILKPDVWYTVKNGEWVLWDD